jgi:hypothetical protein
MAKSKINQEDAQEWLATLQLSGEGWYRNLALAIKADAHKALGMDRREFAAQVGQRMIDPRPAIVELHNEGHSQSAIAEILGVAADRTVRRVLREEGLIEDSRDARDLLPEDSRDARDSAEDTDSDEMVEELEAEIDHLTMQVKGEQAKRKREVEKVKEKLDQARSDLRNKLREERAKEKAKLTDAEKERARKEGEAWVEEQRQKALAGMNALIADHVSGALTEASEDLRRMIDTGWIDPGWMDAIEAAYVAFTEELNVARAMVGSVTTRR